MSEIETIKINEIEYVIKGSLNQERAEELTGLKLCLIRSYGAGVFYGYVKELDYQVNGVNVILLKARRIYYWDGACSLTQLAIDGTTAPQNCKITDPIDSQFIANVIETLPISKKAQTILDGVKSWKK